MNNEFISGYPGNRRLFFLDLSKFYDFQSDLKSYQKEYELPENLSFLSVDSADVMFKRDNLKSFIDHYISLGNKDPLKLLLDKYINLFDNVDKLIITESISRENNLQNIQKKYFKGLYNKKINSFNEFQKDPLTDIIDKDPQLKERRIGFCARKMLFSNLSQKRERGMSHELRDFLESIQVIGDFETFLDFSYLQKGNSVKADEDKMRNIYKEEVLYRLISYFNGLSDYERFENMSHLAFLVSKNEDIKFRDDFTKVLQSQSHGLYPLWNTLLYLYHHTQFDYSVLNKDKGFVSSHEEGYGIVQSFLDNMPNIGKDMLSFGYSLLRSIIPTTVEFMPLLDYLDKEYKKYRDTL